MIAAITGNTTFFLTAVFVFGLLIGSFLNVVILRLPARLEFDWRGQCRDLLELDTADEETAPPGLLWDRSMCRSCGHRLRALENVPLLSYLVLRGRCSACHEKISPRYPLVEGITALAFVVVALHFGPSPQGAGAMLLTAFLIALAGIDIDHQLLPDHLSLPLLWGGLLLSLEPVFADPVASIAGAAIGYLALWLVYHLFRLMTGKEGMGHGDFKLLAALGAWLGWQMLPQIILLSSLLGALVGLSMMLLRRHQQGQPMPFGPFIASAGWIALIWGPEINHYYLRMSGLN